MPRLFVAIDIPTHLVETLSALKDEALHARWTPPEQYHITLRFLGHVDEMTTASLSEALTAVQAEPCEIGVSELGVFPNMRRPRVLVIKLNPDPRLMQLQQEIDRIATNLGIEQDPKPFNPHITIGRLKEASRPARVREFLSTRTHFSLESFQATEFHLYQSKVSNKGAVHSVVQSYLLG